MAIVAVPRGFLINVALFRGLAARPRGTWTTVMPGAPESCRSAVSGPGARRVGALLRMQVRGCLEVRHYNEHRPHRSPGQAAPLKPLPAPLLTSTRSDASDAI